MIVFIYTVAILVAVAAAPPTPHLYQQHPSPQLQQLNQLDYYYDNRDSAKYYQQQQLPQVQANAEPHDGGPVRLENLEPDSEVELIPGAQQPQAPPQQAPVAPNFPGLAPGQRVFIVHMPFSGYRPGTIGGYQPVYIVAAGSQGNPGFPGNGYQNVVFLDSSGQGIGSPYLGYNRPNFVQANPGFVFGQSPLYQTPFGLPYQESLAYQPLAPSQAVLHNTAQVLSQHVSQAVPHNRPQTPDVTRGAVNFSQLVSVQRQGQNTRLDNNPRKVAEVTSDNTDRHSSGSDAPSSVEFTEEEDLRPTNGQTRNSG